MKKLRSLFRSRPHGPSKPDQATVDQARVERARDLWADHVERGEVKCQLCDQAGTIPISGVFSKEISRKIGAEPGCQRAWWCALCSSCAAAPDAKERAKATIIETGDNPLRVVIGKDDDVSRTSLA